MLCMLLTFFFNSTLIALASFRYTAFPQSRSLSEVNWWNFHFLKAHCASSYSCRVQGTRRAKKRNWKHRGFFSKPSHEITYYRWYCHQVLNTSSAGLKPENKNLHFYYSVTKNRFNFSYHWYWRYNAKRIWNVESKTNPNPISLN